MRIVTSNRRGWSGWSSLFSHLYPIRRWFSGYLINGHKCCSWLLFQSGGRNWKNTPKFAGGARAASRRDQCRSRSPSEARTAMMCTAVGRREQSRAGTNTVVTLVPGWATPRALHALLKQCKKTPCFYLLFICVVTVCRQIRHNLICQLPIPTYLKVSLDAQRNGKYMFTKLFRARKLKHFMVGGRSQKLH